MKFAAAQKVQHECDCVFVFEHIFYTIVRGSTLRGTQIMYKVHHQIDCAFETHDQCLLTPTKILSRSLLSKDRSRAWVASLQALNIFGVRAVLALRKTRGVSVETGSSQNEVLECYEKYFREPNKINREFRERNHLDAVRRLFECERV